MSNSAPQRSHLVSRREALQVGAGMFGLTLPGLLAARAAASKTGVSPPAAKKDISCIFIFLAGGPSHFETFDPKPNAPVEIRGLWKPTHTKVPGLFITEKMPLMAQQMDKVAVIRSWQGRSGSHSTGSQHVTSGKYPPRAGQFYPNFGCLVSALNGSRIKGVAPHYGLPVAARYTDPPGYLGAAHAAFNLDGDPSKSEMEIEGLRLPQERFDERQSLLSQMDEIGRLADSNGKSFEAHDKFIEEAAAMLTSGVMKRAVRLEEEPIKLRERYGMNVYGQRVLLARRLIEAGSRFVTINQAVQGGPYGTSGKTAGTWDNHSDIFSFLMTFGGAPPRGRAAHKNWVGYEGPGNLPQLDMSLSTLIDDLDERGMLDTTLIVVMGEFGRTPVINAKGGRDHYPKAGAVLMAGGGVNRGVVIGATDRKGTEPITRPCRPEDFAASIYHGLGIHPFQTYFPRLTRPTPIAEGRVIEGLFS